MLTQSALSGHEPPYNSQEFEGEILPLEKVKRSDTGYYLCIASNGLPPSVSKKIKLEVHCKFTTGHKPSESFPCTALSVPISSSRYPY